MNCLARTLQKHLGDRIVELQVVLGEITVDVDVATYLETMLQLRDEPELRFEQLIDLCGVDYSTYADWPLEWKALRRCHSSGIDCSQLAFARSLLRLG